MLNSQKILYSNDLVELIGCFRMTMCLSLQSSCFIRGSIRRANADLLPSTFFINGDREQQMLIIDSIPRTMLIYLGWHAYLYLIRRAFVHSHERNNQKADDTQDLVMQLKLVTSRTM